MSTKIYNLYKKGGAIMKKILVFMLTMMMSFGLTACGGGEEQTDPVETEDSSAEEEEAAEEEETEEPEKKEEEADTGDTDVSSAIEGSSTSETEAVPLGQWAKVADYATEDEAYHTVYVRVTKVTTSEADEAYVQSSIETNNTNSSEYGQINTADIELPDDVELCVLDYEVFVPEEFPAPEYGMVAPEMDFSETNIDGGGIPSADGASTYIGLGTNNTGLMMEPDKTYEPGNTYSFRTLFTMVKGYEDYVFEMMSYPDGTLSDQTSGDNLYYVYFANK